MRKCFIYSNGHTNPNPDKVFYIELVLVCLPVWVFLHFKLATSFPKLSDSFGKVIDSLLECGMLVEEVACAHLVLCTVIAHHVKLLLRHPSFGFCRIEKVLKMEQILSLEHTKW